jgi:hypothetical protein
MARQINSTDGLFQQPFVGIGYWAFSISDATGL